MTIKARIKTLEEAPEEIRSLYVEKDGEFSLAVEGLVGKEKLDEFRVSNISLKKQIEDLNAKFEGVDPDVFRELNEKAEKERTKKLIAADKVDELVAERVNAAKAGFDKQYKGLEDEKRKLGIQLESLLIDNAVRDGAAKSGVRASAVEDVLLRARQVFKVVDGKAVAFDGDKQLFGPTGDPLTVPEYITGKLTEAAPHLFEPSQGGGAKKADSNNSGGAGGKINRNDSKAFLDNLGAIASGQKQVA
jgi:hypothetical protein